MVGKKTTTIFVVCAIAFLVGSVCKIIHRNQVATPSHSRPSVLRFSGGGTGKTAAMEAKLRDNNRRGYSVMGRSRIPYHKAVTAAESNEVHKAFCELVELYKNMQVEAFRQKMTQMPDSAVKMPSDCYLTIRRPLAAIFNDRFLWSDRLEEFLEENEFERFAEMNTMTAGFLGDMYLQRGDLCKELWVLDRNTLHHLLRYKRKFQTEGRGGLEKITRRFIDKWRQQIDSPRGFTRRYMWFQTDLQWEHIEEGSWTLEQLVGFVRTYAQGLVDLGHTPKWIDEFQANEDFIRLKEIPFK